MVGGDLIDGSVSVMERRAVIWRMTAYGFWFSFSTGSYLNRSLYSQPSPHGRIFSTLSLSMNAPMVPTVPVSDETCVRKSRCENRWTAAEDKVLLSQVLKGNSPLRRRTPTFSLTYSQLTVARSAGDLSLPHCQGEITSLAGRGTYPSSFDVPVV